MPYDDPLPLLIDQRFLMRRLSLVFAAAGVLLAGCGSSDSPTGTNSGGTSSVYTASVGGVAWAAVFPVVWTVTNTGVTISGASAGGATTVTLSFLATAPGTYSLAFNQNTGGIATVAQSNGKGWSTIGQGGTGSVTLTTLATNHIVGTFTFDAVTAPNGVVDLIHVTNGKFDLKL
jgi:hypothetical protein